MDVNFLELLESQRELKSKGKCLSKENNLKLLDYEVSIWNHFEWQQKDRYFLVITNFLDKKIDIEQYISQIFELTYEIQDLVKELELDFEKLKEFQPNPVPERFSEGMLYLRSDCRAFEPDPGENDISETQLIEYLRKIFLQLQEY